jgi:hypothetical protein
MSGLLSLSLLYEGANGFAGHSGYAVSATTHPVLKGEVLERLVLIPVNIEGMRRLHHALRPRTGCTGSGAPPAWAATTAIGEDTHPGTACSKIGQA